MFIGIFTFYYSRYLTGFCYEIVIVISVSSENSTIIGDRNVLLTPLQKQ